MCRTIKRKHVVTIVLLIALLLIGAGAAYAQPAFAASGIAAPGRAAIKSIGVKENVVTVKWSKTRRASKYKVYVRKGPNKWKYLKKIKRTKANKKKYSNKINYKLVSSGKKYKVYKRVNLFRLKATVKKNSYVFKGEYGKSYGIAIRAYAGKKAGAYSKIKTAKIPKKAVKPEPMNINGKGMDNMIWSWWYYPQVVSCENGNVIWGYATNDGYSGVAEYDRESGAVTKTALKKTDSADDHNGLALTVLKDNRIMCAYSGGHDATKDIHIRISDEPLDTTRFSTEVVLESKWVTSYSQILYSNGKYWLFYRVNNKMWAYRTSEDGLEWSDETVAVTADMQYYCRFVPTSDKDLIRILMVSNPAYDALDIRQGFVDTSDGKIYNSDRKEVLGDADVAFDRFDVLIEHPKGKAQRLFDAAVTNPDRPLILYSLFTRKKGLNDSAYYLYDKGDSVKICDGGAALMDYKYQLGACFVDENTIVVARNNAGCDHVELYDYSSGTLSFAKELDQQPGSASSRDARPIADVNGKAILWHNGRYSKDGYTDFDTSARLYLMDSDVIIKDAQSGSDMAALSQPDQSNVDAVLGYAEKLYSENMTSGRDYLAGGFTWDQEYVRSKSKDPDAVTYGWKYFNALMMEAFISDDQGYIPEVLRFYDSHFDSDGNLLIAHNRKYPGGTVDTAMPAAPMIELVIMGAADEAQTANYNKAANTVYNKLENQYMYDGEDGRPYAGKIWMHHQMKDSETGEIVPVSAWSKWPVCLDGIYMSQIFLIRLAEAIDTGKMEIRSVDGHIVSSQELWSDIYTRLNYAADHLRIQETGLMTHVYSPDRGEANNISWSRGTGWFMMAMLEAIDKMPDGPERQELLKQFDSIMRSVLEWQDPDSQLWYNIMTRKADLSKNRPETSGSAMLAYCLLKGYKTGILKDEEFRRAGLAAFNALVNEHFDEEAGLSDTLISMGPADTEAAYQKPQFVTNEAKGIAPLIMAAEYVMP